MQLGLPRYRGGRPCPQGHTERQTVNGSCIECMRAKALTERKTSEYRKARNERLRASEKSELARLRERVYQLEHRDERAAWGARYRQSPKGQAAARKKNIERYGISQEQYNALFNEQKGACAICSEHPETRCLDVDHKHGTTKVRGLLCSRCNTGLGLFMDSPELLREAAFYLEHSGA